MVNSLLVETEVTCPHCGKGVRLVKAEQYLPNGSYRSEDFSWLIASGADDVLSVMSARCPSCKKPIVRLFHGTKDGTIYSTSRYVFPLGSSRFVPPEVTGPVREDFVEASEVLPISQKASAALSRRCLQTILIEKGGVKASDSLSKQIDAVLPTLPTYIADDLDAVRNIGNFAAHPMKDKNTGQIVDVETGEAEWNLDVIEELFDYYYVKPAQSQAKRQALDAKLQAAGKPPMKKP